MSRRLRMAAPDRHGALDHEHYRSDLLERVLRVTMILGTLICVPSVYMAAREGLVVVAVGDVLALLGLAVLVFVRRLGYRVRASGFCALLYLLGTMLLVYVGPVSQIYLLGFSVIATALLGLRTGAFTLALNASTLMAIGSANMAAAPFSPPAFVSGAGGWAVVSLNFLLVNAALVVAVGAVLRNLESGLEREARAREALEQSEALLRMASHVGRLGAWRYAIRSGALTWSSETRAIHELDAEATPTTEASIAFYVPEDRPRIREALTRCATEGTPFDLELTIETAKGRRRATRAIGHAARDGTGTLVAIQGTFQDISEQKDAERSLRESEARFRSLCQATNDAIWDLDLATNAIWWNEGIETLFGHPRDESILTRDTFTARVHADDRERVESAVRNLVREGGQRFTAEHGFERRDGTYAHVLTRVVVIRDADERPIRLIGGMTDLSERKRLEQHLLRAQRLESIGTLAGGIAHDLNNVLTPILASIAFLKEAETSTEKLDDLAIIETAGRHGADMVRQLLMFARGSRDATRVVVDVGVIANESFKMVRDTLPKNITASLTVDAHVWPVKADPTELHQLFTNLCVNARDAMPEGGVLTVTVAGVEIDDVYAGMTMDAKPGPYVLVRVEDTGAGMSAATQARIFEPFFTTKPLGKGTGLGLSTCHTIVRGLGGFIHVYSELDKGTRFKIYLPADLSGERPIAEPAPVPLPRGAGELVLVVDDDANVRLLTSRTLERFGYRALTASNGAEAVSLYARHMDDVAVVLTDMSMPVMDGPATIVALRAIAPHVAVIGSSGLDDAGKVAKALGVGVSDFIPKPYTAETLLQTVARVIVRRGGR